MAEERGIAEDGGEYEDFPDEGKVTKRPSNPAIAQDVAGFEDLVQEGDDSLELSASWLYKSGAQVFGPINSVALVKKLYDGEVDGETLIAPEDGEFMALRRYGAFRAHLPKVTEHRAAVVDVKNKESAAKNARLRQRILFGVVATAIGVGALVGTATLVAQDRAEKARAAKEQQMREEFEKLLASVTIEPPLVPVEEAPPEPLDPKGKKGKRKAVSKLPAATGALTPAEVIGGVNQAFGGFKRCIVEQIQRDAASVPEKLVVSFSVVNSGQVQSVDLNERGLRKTPLLPCIDRVLSRVGFRAFTGEVQNIDYPITIGRH